MDSTSSFEASLVFLPRKLQYSCKDSNIWIMIMSPQMMKLLKLIHDSTYIVLNQDHKACIRVHNSVEYGMEYSFLKSPKVVATEELKMCLNLNFNETTMLRFVKLADVNVASELQLSYLECFNDGEWKRCVTTEGKSEMKFTSWSSNNQVLYPSTNWWYSLLNGEFNYIIASSLQGCVLFKDNILVVNLKGVLVRFKVLKIKGNGKEPWRIVNNCQLTVKIESKLEKMTENIVESPKIGGMNEVLDTIKWHVIYPLVYQEKYSKLGINPQKGVLLYGPPGTGKTYLARCIRDDYKNLFSIDDDIMFKMVQSSDLLSSSIGRTEECLMELFRECSLYPGKCICFIDEIDILCQSRDKFNDFNRRIVTTFLNNLDGLNTCTLNNFVIIGMTNDIDSLDLALRRPGRFDLEIEIGVPNSINRLDILKNLLENINHNLNNDEILYINDHCQAFVGADLKALITNASLSHLNRIKFTSIDDPLITINDFKNALKLTKPSALKELYIQIPNVKWDDIGGYNDVKNSLKECVEYPLLFNHAYEKLHIQPPKGVLLYGPPGCSKTLMAKAIATESHMNFISVKGPELYSKWVGESERAIRQIFKKARVNSPCVIFFDEIDSIALDRDESDTSGVGNRVLSQLLNEMDGITLLKQVIVIGATNRPDMLDPALLRPGRLDRLIYIPLPDLNARISIFNIYLKKLYTYGLDINQTSIEFAEKTDGYTGAEISMICKESALCALREYIKLKEEEKGNSLTEEFNKLNIKDGNDIIPISKHHIESAHLKIKPRITKKSSTFITTIINHTHSKASPNQSHSVIAIYHLLYII